MPRHAPITIGRAAGVHRRRITAQVLEYRGLPILVGHTIPLEDDTAFIFTFRISFGEFRVLLHTYAEKIPEIYLLASFPCLSGNVIPFADGSFIPDILVTQPFPLCAHSLGGGLDPTDLGFTHRARHACIEWKRRHGKLIPMPASIRIS